MLVHTFRVKLFESVPLWLAPQSAPNVSFAQSKSFTNDTWISGMRTVQSTEMCQNILTILAIWKNQLFHELHFVLIFRNENYSHEKIVYLKMETFRDVLGVNSPILRTRAMFCVWTNNKTLNYLQIQFSRHANMTISLSLSECLSSLHNLSPACSLRLTRHE